MASENRELQTEQEHSRTKAPHIQLVVPRADVIEKTDSFLVLADVPGVDEKGVDIHVERNILTIHARIDHPTFPKQKLAYQEYEPTGYERQFTLSDEVDINRIEATVRNGVLQIRLPKAEQARPRRIEVTAA